MSVLEDLAVAVENGRKMQAEELTRAAMKEGFPPEFILSDSLLVAMDTVGIRYALNQIYVPEMLVAARAMEACVEVLKPYLATIDTAVVGRAAICSVEGDVHDLGKNLVKIHLEMRGFEVDDLGVDVSAGDIVRYLKEVPECSVLCLSALLTTTMPYMRDIIDALKKNRLRSRVKVMVGGGPVTQGYADAIGADAYTPDAFACAARAAELASAPKTMNGRRF